MKMDIKMGTISGLVLLFVAVVCMLPSIPQDPRYHMYADQRTVFGVVHFRNVISNIPFLLLGALGMISVARNRTPGYLPEMKWAYFTFFTGVVLTGLGSSYYHLNPVNQNIVWDRLALSILFMSFFSTIWAEHISVTAGRRMLWPLIAVGLASVLYWYVTEINGRGDLRPYVLVQFLPMLLLPVIMLLYRSGLTGVGYIWGLILAYALAKILEVFDIPIYKALGGTGGHEIKHWVAGAGIFIYYLAGLRRRPRKL